LPVAALSASRLPGQTSDSPSRGAIPPGSEEDTGHRIPSKAASAVRDRSDSIMRHRHVIVKGHSGVPLSKVVGVGSVFVTFGRQAPRPAHRHCGERVSETTRRLRDRYTPRPRLPATPPLLPEGIPTTVQSRLRVPPGGATKKLQRAGTL